MNFQFLLEKLTFSDEFINFKKSNQDMYLCSGFFIFDYESNFKNNKYTLDFYVPSTKNLISFELEDGIKFVPLDNYNEEVPGILNDNLDFDFEKLKNLILKEIEIRKINNKVQKMIFSLQKNKDGIFLLGTIFVSNLGLIKITIEIKTTSQENSQFDLEIIDFEKKSFFDMLKIFKK